MAKEYNENSQFIMEKEILRVQGEGEVAGAVLPRAPRASRGGKGLGTPRRAGVQVGVGVKNGQGHRKPEEESDRRTSALLWRSIAGQ